MQAQQLQHVDRRHLTPVMRKIVDAIGLELTCQLLQVRGGTRIFCSRSDRPSPLLTGIIGTGPALAMMLALRDAKAARRTPQQFISLPKADQILTQLRDAEICASADSDASLALRYGITERWVSKIRNGHSRKAGVASAQGDLFSQGCA